MRTLIFLSVVLLVLVAGWASAKTEADYHISVKHMEVFSQESDYVDLLFPTPGKRRQVVRNMPPKTDAKCKMNLCYFIPATGVPVGRIKRHGYNLTEYSLEQNRACLWQTDKLYCGFAPPSNTVFTVEIGPLVVGNGVVIPSYPQGFKESYWKEAGYHTVFGMNNKRFCFAIIKGKYRNIGRFMLDGGYPDAICADGGGSSQSECGNPSGEYRPVPVGIGVFSKDWPGKKGWSYQSYYRENFWAQNIQEIEKAKAAKPKKTDSEPPAVPLLVPTPQFEEKEVFPGLNLPFRQPWTLPSSSLDLWHGLKPEWVRRYRAPLSFYKEKKTSLFWKGESNFLIKRTPFLVIPFSES